MVRHKKEKPLKKQILDEFLSKLRKAIRPYIKKYKNARKHPKGYWISDFSGYRIRDNSNVQVDHIASSGKSFRQLAYDYIKSKDINLELINELSQAEIAQILKDWVVYHNQNAELQIVSKSQNKYLWLLHKEKDIHYTQFYQN